MRQGEAPKIIDADYVVVRPADPTPREVLKAGPWWAYRISWPVPNFIGLAAIIFAFMAAFVAVGLKARADAARWRNNFDNLNRECSRLLHDNNPDKGCGAYPPVLVEPPSAG